ncbi:myogenesis-regulating glycosidase-like [Dendronephthya gigantea]|uniref:myogenesis-regulating glycosidase-like n=1 Tax=Dendronephthya gigantea TaxID=151771 RepID=UPI00106A3CBA|nr:myogenesis-regulating glycosidase-like [Dendronephthya gigantea]
MASKKKEFDEIQLVSKLSFSGTKADKSRFIFKLVGLALILFVIGVILCVLIVTNYGERNTPQARCGVVDLFDDGRKNIRLVDHEDPSSIIAEIGLNVHEKMYSHPIEGGVEYIWRNGLALVVQDQGNNCTSLHWSGLTDIDDYPMDCFFLSGRNWYGGAELYQQVWPFEKSVMEMAAYYPQDTINAYYKKLNAFGPILGRYWVNSQGIAIVVDQLSPLVVGINMEKQPDKLCLSIDPNQYPKTSVPPTLNYTVCKGDNVKTTHQAMAQKYFKKLTSGIDLKMMEDPVWSTWVKYHAAVNQKDVEEFVDQIVANNFKCSQLEIDNNYTTKYGDLDFDPVKFPTPKDMIEKIHRAGCRVTTWVHPFAEMTSKAYAEGRELGMFVLGGDDRTPGLVMWWEGIAAAIDVTKPSAYDWFLNRLKEFQKDYTIDSFKFDAGSVSYLPFQYNLNGSKIPSDYSVQYAKLASDINNIVEVRVADHSQDLSVFVRFLDRDPAWDSAMGLQSVIPTVLTFGILGYPFILPDMIGGNGDPDKELFIRWMQLNAFLPSMQFSHAPWDFDNETIAIAHNVMNIRASIMPTLREGMENAVQTGDPIIRPLWWIAPNDPLALTVDQQFMVTDVYLVAPVVTQGAQGHNVYLPKGVWIEEFGNRATHNMAEGGIVTYNNTALGDVYYFKNIATQQ